MFTVTSKIMENISLEQTILESAFFVKSHASLLQLKRRLGYQHFILTNFLGRIVGDRLLHISNKDLLKKYNKKVVA